MSLVEMDKTIAIEKDKKRGRPSNAKSPYNVKNKKTKGDAIVINPIVSLDEIVAKVSLNLNFSFIHHHTWLNEVLPLDKEDLCKMAGELEANVGDITLSDIDRDISANITDLNNNSHHFDEINDLIEVFVDDDMDEKLLGVLQGFIDKVKFLREEKLKKAYAIIRKSICIKMFPELKSDVMPPNED